MSIDFVVEESKFISGIRIITPSVYDESRGSIWTSYNSSQICNLVPDDLSF